MLDRRSSLETSWEELAADIIQKTVGSQLSACVKDKYEILNSFKFKARFGNFYPRNCNPNYLKMSLSHLGDELKNSKVYRDNATRDVNHEILKSLEEKSDENSKEIEKVELTKVSTIRGNYNTEEKVINKRMSSYFYPGIISINNNEDLKKANDIFEQALSMCGFSENKQFDIGKLNNYTWKMSIDVSRSCEVDFKLNSKCEIIGKVSERQLLWLHATIVADRKTKSPYINYIRLRMETVDVVNPEDNLFLKLFPDGKMTQPLFVDPDNGRPTIIEVFKSKLIILKQFTSRRYFENPERAIWARVTEGVDYCQNLENSKQFCELTMFFNEVELKNAIKSQTGLRTIHDIVDNAVKISIKNLPNYSRFGISIDENSNRDLGTSISNGF